MKLGFRTGLADCREILSVCMLYCLHLFNSLGKSGRGEERNCCLHCMKKAQPEGRVECECRCSKSEPPESVFLLLCSLALSVAMGGGKLEFSISMGLGDQSLIVNVHLVVEKSLLTTPGLR